MYPPTVQQTVTAAHEEPSLREMNEICVNGNDQRQYSVILLAMDSWLDSETDIIGYEKELLPASRNIGAQMTNSCAYARWIHFIDYFENQFPFLEDWGGYLEKPQ